jgi:two-component system, NarL family, invasion response regulator UvrY
MNAEPELTPLPQPIRLLLVDDHAIVRAGYRHLLRRQSHLDLLDEAESAEQAYLSYQRLRPDVVVTDMALPGQSGLELTRRLLAWDPQARVLMFSMHGSADFAQVALKAGARGYVTKSSPAETLIHAIAEVAAGRRALSPDVAQAIALARIDDAHAQGLGELTPREFDVLRMLLAPMPVSTIATTLHLSEKTVCNLHYQIKRKLGVANDIELTKVALPWMEAREGEGAP